MTDVLLRGDWAEFVLHGRWKRRVLIDVEDIPKVHGRKWYWHCRRGVYCAAQKVLLSRVLLLNYRGPIVFANGDMSDLRKRNLLPTGRLSRRGVFFDRERGKYVAQIRKAGLRVKVRCDSMSAAEAMRAKLSMMTPAELVAWRCRQDGGIPEELAWMGEDVAPLIATRCAHDAVLAARKGYEAGLLAQRYRAAGESFKTMN